MIRILFLILLIFALGAGFAWLADNPGSIQLSIRGYEITISLMATAIISLLLIVVLVVLWVVVRALIRAPRALRRQTVDRRRELGHHALSQGMIAVAAGDAKLAAHYAAEMRHYARGEAMTLMLNAEASQLTGDDMGARSAYEAMLARPETRILGLRGLYGEAKRRGDTAAARSFAEEAAKEKPGLGWAGNALLEYQAAGGEWAAALGTLAALMQAGTIDGTRGQRLKAVLLTARAEELEPGDPEAARDNAVEAHRLAPDFVPAAVTAARLASRLGDARKASRVIETTWKVEPHPELAAAYMTIRPGESGRDRLKRIRQLVKIRANHLEGQLALARAAIEAQEWATAREELRGVLATEPSERAYLMMAEIEEGEHSDIGRARDWLGRAVRAPRDPAWMADGYVFDHWEPVSPISGRLDAFEWKLPVERMPGGQPAPLPPFPDRSEPARPQVTAVAVTPQPQTSVIALPAVLERIAVSETAGRQADTARPPGPGPKIHDIEPEEPEPAATGADDGSGKTVENAEAEAAAPANPTPTEPSAEDGTEPSRPTPWGRGKRKFRLFS